MKMAMMIEFVIIKIEKIWPKIKSEKFYLILYRNRLMSNWSINTIVFVSWRPKLTGACPGLFMWLLTTTKWGRKNLLILRLGPSSGGGNISGNCDTVTALPFPETQSEAHLLSELCSPLSFLQLHFSWPGIGRACSLHCCRLLPCPSLKWIITSMFIGYCNLQAGRFENLNVPFQWCIETRSSIKLKETFKPNGTKYVWVDIRADPFSRWAPDLRLDTACMTDHNGWRSWSNINFEFIFKHVNSDFDEIPSGSKWTELTWLPERP